MTLFDDEILQDPDLAHYIRAWAATASRDWDEYANCKNLPADYFFEEEHDPGRCCKDCPVMIECRDDALKYKDNDGFRGGMSEEARRLLRLARAKYNRFFTDDLKRAFEDDRT